MVDGGVCDEVGCSSGDLWPPAHGFAWHKAAPAAVPGPPSSSLPGLRAPVDASTMAGSYMHNVPSFQNVAAAPGIPNHAAIPVPGGFGDKSQVTSAADLKTFGPRIHPPSHQLYGRQAVSYPPANIRRGIRSIDKLTIRLDYLCRALCQYESPTTSS